MPLLYDFNGSFSDISLAGETLKTTRQAGQPHEPALSLYVPPEIGAVANAKLREKGYTAFSNPDAEVPDKWRIIITGEESMKKAALEGANFTGAARYLPPETSKA